jgi:cytochrome P450
MATTRPSSEAGHAGELSPLCPAAHSDALDWFRYLQQNSPVHLDEEGRYVLTRYEDVYSALRNEPEVWSSEHVLLTADHPLANTRWIPYADDPDHMELRRLVNRGWTPTAVTELEPSLRASLAEVLGGIEPDQEFDAYPVGYQYITQSFGDAVGLPPDQRDRLDVWTTVAMNFARPREQRAPAPRDPGPNLSVAAEFEDGYRDMKAYFSDLVEEHRDHEPGFCKEVEGLPPFPRAVVKAIKDHPADVDVFLQRVYPPMHLGGMSTVTHIFSNVVAVLLEHPNAWAMLKEDRSLIDLDEPSEVVEEILRLRSSHAGLHKRPQRDLEVRGSVIPKGSMVQLYYVAADRDPEAFEQPDDFKLRGISRHLAFGFGTHTCMGQSFVRLAIKIFLGGLLDKFSQLECGSVAPDWSFTGTYFTPPTMLVVGRT